VPANRGSNELVRTNISQQFEVVDEDEQRRLAHLTEREFGLEEVAPLDGAGEASMRRSLACHPTLRLQGRTAERIYSDRQLEPSQWLANDGATLRPESIRMEE
jgi:hypothetical protein